MAGAASVAAAAIPDVLRKSLRVGSMVFMMLIGEMGWLSRRHLAPMFAFVQSVVTAFRV
jgi:hypothetical protein